jgi:hypothetical protein
VIADGPGRVSSSRLRWSPSTSSSIEFQKSLPIVPTRRVVGLIAVGWAAVSFTWAYAMSLSAPVVGLEAPRILRYELAKVVALRHRSRREGLYSLEARLFHALGAPQPREVQWDMFVPLLPFIFLVLIVGINLPVLEAQEGALAYLMLVVVSLLLLG